MPSRYFIGWDGINEALSRLNKPTEPSLEMLVKAYQRRVLHIINFKRVKNALVDLIGEGFEDDVRVQLVLDEHGQPVIEVE